MTKNTLCQWIYQDAMRMEALTAVAKLQLPDWCIAAGFVRNLVWDKLHQYNQSTPLADIDVIYFDATDSRREKDVDLEKQLARDLDLPWSVKNQARMHERNQHRPYKSTVDAMAYWVEIETAVGVRLERDKSLTMVSPFNLHQLEKGEITFNPKSELREFRKRCKNKSWLDRWPNLKIVESMSQPV